MGKGWLADSGHCASIQTLSHSTFFFYMDLLTKDVGPGCYLHVS